MPSKKQRSKSAKSSKSKSAKLPKGFATILEYFKFVTKSPNFMATIDDIDHQPPWMVHSQMLPDMQVDGEIQSFIDNVNYSELGAAALFMHDFGADNSMGDSKMNCWEYDNWKCRVDATTNLLLQNNKDCDCGELLLDRHHTLFPFLFSQWDVCNPSVEAQYEATQSATKYTSVELVNRSEDSIEFELQDSGHMGENAVPSKHIGGQVISKKLNKKDHEELWEKLGADTCDDNELVGNFIMANGALSLMNRYLAEVQRCRTQSWEIIYKWAIAFGIDFANWATNLALDNTIAVMKYFYGADAFKTPGDFDPKTGRGYYEDEDRNAAMDEITKGMMSVSVKHFGIQTNYCSRLMEIRATTPFTKIMRQELSLIDNKVFAGIGGGQSQAGGDPLGMPELNDWFKERQMSKKVASDFIDLGMGVRRIYSESAQLTRDLLMGHIDPILIGFRIAANERDFPPLVTQFWRMANIHKHNLNTRCDKHKFPDELGTYGDNFIAKLDKGHISCGLVDGTKRYGHISGLFKGIQSSMSSWSNTMKLFLKDYTGDSSVGNAEAALVCSELGHHKLKSDGGKMLHYLSQIHAFDVEELVAHINPWTLKTSRDAWDDSMPFASYNVGYVMMLAGWMGGANPAFCGVSEVEELNRDSLEEWMHPMAEHAVDVVRSLCNTYDKDPHEVFYYHY